MRSKVLALVVSLAFLVAVGCWVGHQYLECTESGGTLVRGLFGWICLNRGN